MAPNSPLMLVYRLYRVLHAPVARSWRLSRLWYRLFGIRLEGHPDDELWYVGYGANMHDAVFRRGRGIEALEWRPGCIRGYRLRFNLEGRPRGRAAPANIEPAAGSEVWAVLYRITRRDLVWLDHTEVVPGWHYRHQWLEAEDRDGNRLAPAVAYLADGNEHDGRPSLRYLTLLREGARAHGLPEHWLRFLDGIEPADGGLNDHHETGEERPMGSSDKPGSGLRNMSRDSGDVAQYYDDWAEGYDRTLTEWRYEAPQQVAARLRAALDPEAVILDAGCGTGLSGTALVDAGFATIDGIDVSQRSLDIAARLGVYRSLQYVDMQKLPLPPDADRYDGLVCVGVLTYVPDSIGILREFCRIVRPGGHMVLTQRDDILAERDFGATLQQLQDEGLLERSAISDPMPYLPENEEFADEVRVHYITCAVASA